MLEINEVAVDGLKIDENNPREMSKHDFDSLKRAIQELGFVQPLVVRKKNNKIISGHQRLKALQEMGRKTVPVIFVDLNENKARLLGLALNRISGTWDEEKLAEIIHQLDQVKTEDISLTGFKEGEIEDLLEGLEVDLPESFDLVKEAKKAEVKIKTRVGDLYQLGPHRLLCGDSTKKEDVLRLFDGKKADMCFTDPPYILAYLKANYKGKLRGFGHKTNRKYLTTDEAPKLDDWLANVHLVAKRDFNIIVFENWKNTVQVWQALEKHWKVKNMIVWHLTNRCQGFSAKSFYSKYDIALFASSQAKVELNLKPEDEPLENEYLVALYGIGGGKPYFDNKAAKGKYFASDHIESGACDATSSGQSIIFGTKPVEILIPYIKILTRKGDVIYEPFGGSGSTLIAAEKLKRVCYMMEKTPLYCDVEIARWRKYAGSEPKKLNG
jgi:DNA modification methylase